MKTYSYLHLDENIDQDAYVICDYRVTTDMPMEKAAEAIAAEQSTGTWTGISTLTEDVFEKYGGRVTKINKDSIRIAYPVDDFSLDIGAVPQILSVIAGNLFGLESIGKLRLEDVFFPKCMLKEFKGPKFGIKGLRDYLKRPEKPLVGTIVKPKIGLPPKEFAEYVYQAGKGGLTNSKDDETLSNQKFCPIEDRTVAVAEALDRLKSEGHMMMHAINVSTSGHEILEVAEKVQSWGAKELMVDVITCGFAAVQALAEDPSIKVPIHVHRTMHAAMTKDPTNGISMRVIAKLVRMCGGDALHIGTLGVGKMEGAITEGKQNQLACQSDDVPYKKVMPVCSGGMYPGIVPAVIKAAGTNNLQIQAGGGVAGHPEGVRAGAMAMCQAVDSAFEGVDIEKYAETHHELRLALDRWGTK